MKRVLPILFVATLLSTPAVAGDDSGLVLGVGVDIAVPVKEWQAGFGFGCMAEIGYDWDDSVLLGLRTGFIYHVAEEVSLFGSEGVDISYFEVPFLTGLRFKTPIGVFAEFYMGMVVNGFEADGKSDTEAEFGILAGGGYSFHGFRFALSYFLPEISNKEETGALVFTLGYDFDL